MDDRVTITYKRVQCPVDKGGCGSYNCPNDGGTRKKGNVIIRYHTCSDCGHKFKSVEVIHG